MFNNISLSDTVVKCMKRKFKADKKRNLKIIFTLKKIHYSPSETICPAVRLDINDCFCRICKKTDKQFNPHLTRSLTEIVIRSDNLRYE